MKDMTSGPVRGHVLSMSAFIAMSTLFQTLYFLADLFFVGKLGPQAVAGVMLGGNLMMFVVALTQSLGVGTTAVIGQSLGARDVPRANTAFNQAFVLSLLVGVAFAICALALRAPYCRRLGADDATAAQGLAYLSWFIPALFMNFVLVAMGAALRGMGDMKAPMLIQIGSVVLNVDPGAGPHVRLADGAPDGRRRHRAGLFHRRRLRRHRLRAAVPPCPHADPLRPLAVDAAAEAVVADAAHRPACRRRVRGADGLPGVRLRRCSGRSARSRRPASASAAG